MSILQAGGAAIITLNQALTVGAHFCVTKPNRAASDPKLKQLRGAGLCIVSPSFVVEWVAHPWNSPAKVRTFCFWAWIEPRMIVPEPASGLSLAEIIAACLKYLTVEAQIDT